MPKTSKSRIIAYVPVLHRGYLQLFDAFPEAEELYVIADEYIKKVDYLRKDLRALKPKQAVDILGATGRFNQVKLLDSAALKKLDKPGNEIIMPKEDISHLVGKNIKHALVTYYPVFLRWDRRNVEALDENDVEETLTLAEPDQTMMKKALRATAKSSDIFRRVGAILLDKTGRVVGTASNQGEPTPHSPWIEGDPRNLFNRGVAIEMSVFTHAEAVLVAEAAKTGTSLDGASLYVSTFPCPACAKLIAHSGIKRVYYHDGYAVLDGKRVMEDYGVELKRVMVEFNDEDPESLVTYVKKPGQR